MLDLVNNLNKRICDCEPGAKNTQTYLEYIIDAYNYIDSPLSESFINKLNSTTDNKWLNEVLEEIDELVTK